MSVLTDLALQVHDYHGRRRPVEDWEQFVNHDAMTMQGFLGYHTFTTLGRRPWRFADARSTCTVGSGLILPAMSELELRAPYIDRCNGRRPRPRWSHWDEEAMHETDGGAIPHYRAPGMPTGPVVGMDMDASYWRFVQHFSTAVEYRPSNGAWGAVGAEWLDIPTLMPMKMLRSAICTASWRNKTSTWTNGHDLERTVRNPYYQPQAWRLLSDYLMSWAQEVISLFQPWAIVVDCVVLEPEKIPDFLDFQLDRWNVTSHQERTWEPGQAWPWPSAKLAGHNIRAIPDAVRQALSWHITGHGPHTPPLIATRENGELELTEAPPEPEPEPAAWQAKRGMRRWDLVHVVITAPSRQVTHHAATAVRGRRCRLSSMGQGVAVWTEGDPRAPPEEAPKTGGILGEADLARLIAHYQAIEERLRAEKEKGNG